MGIIFAIFLISTISALVINIKDKNYYASGKDIIYLKTTNVSCTQENYFSGLNMCNTRYFLSYYYLGDEIEDTASLRCDLTITRYIAGIQDDTYEKKNIVFNMGKSGASYSTSVLEDKSITYKAVASNVKYTMNGNDWYEAIIDTSITTEKIEEMQTDRTAAYQTAEKNFKTLIFVIPIVSLLLLLFMVYPWAAILQSKLPFMASKKMLEEQNKFLKENADLIKENADLSAELGVDAVTKTAKALKKGLKDEKDQ